MSVVVAEKTRTSGFGFTRSLLLPRRYSRRPISFVIIFLRFRLPFLLADLRSRYLFQVFFALRAEPFPFRDIGQRRIETLEVVWVVALETPSAMAPAVMEWNLTLSHCRADSSSPSSVLHTTHAGGGFTSMGCLGKSDSLELGFARKKVVFWPAAMLTKDVSSSVRKREHMPSYLRTSMPLNGWFLLGLVQLLGSPGPIPSSSNQGSERNNDVQTIQHTVCSILAPGHSHDTTVVIIRQSPMCDTAAGCELDLACPISEEIRVSHKKRRLLLT